MVIVHVEKNKFFNWVVCFGTMVVAAAVLTLVGGCATGKSYRLVMGDMHRDLGELTGMTEDPLLATPVEFMQVDKPNYDKFFESSARIRAGLIVSKAFAEAFTKNVKAYARSYVAANEADKSVKDLAGDNPDQMTDDQAIAVMKLKKERGQLSEDEAKYFVSGLANLAQMVTYLNVTVGGVKDLIDSGKALISSSTNDFAGPDARKLPAVGKGLKDSVVNLGEAGGEIPGLVQSFAKLIEGLKAIS